MQYLDNGGNEMKKAVESYVLGEGKAPEWFNKEANAGRVKLIYDEDDQLIGAQILSGMKVYDALIGDSIINTKYGLAVLPKEKAKQYGVQKKDDKQIKERDDKEEKAEE